jgi:hypothetical protein
MINGKKDYEKLTNKDFDALVEQNGQSIKDMSWDSYSVHGDSKSYPMWKAATGYHTNSSFDEVSAHFESMNSLGSKELKDKQDAMKTSESKKFDLDMTSEPVIFGEFFDAMKKIGKDDDKTGVVEPKEDMGKQNVPKEEKSKADSPKEDNSGAVKVPKAEFGGSAKKETEVKVDTEKETKVEKAPKAPKGDNVGVVKPTADMGKQNVPSFTTLNPINVDGDDLTGIVKPQSDFGGKAKMVTETDSTKEHKVETKSAFMESMDMVGQFNSLMGE